MPDAGLHSMVELLQVRDSATNIRFCL
jgi:hypothetical protein